MYPSLLCSSYSSPNFMIIWKGSENHNHYTAVMQQSRNKTSIPLTLWLEMKEQGGLVETKKAEKEGKICPLWWLPLSGLICLAWTGHLIDSSAWPHINQCFASSSSQNLEYWSESIKFFTSPVSLISTLIIHPFSYGLELT